MKQQVEFQNTLRLHFEEIKVKNASYSLRAFARKLDLSPSALSEILNGKRRISKKIATRVLERLNFAPSETDRLIQSIEDKTPASYNGPQKKAALELKRKVDFLQLSNDQFNMIGEWQHFALLSLIETKNFKSDHGWMAQRLGLTVTQTQNTLERLIRLGFVLKKNGKYTTNKQALLTSDNIPNQAVRKSHYADLKLAEKALDECPVELRDFTANTVSVNTKQLDKAKDLIRRFQDELTLLLEEGTCDEVYKFTFYLYPLTTNDSKKDSK